MAQVVTAENFSELIETGKVAEFVKPEPEKKEPEAKAEEKPVVDAKKEEPEKKDDKKVDNNSEDSDTGLTLSDAELTERAQKRINHKHRQMRLAEEATKAETSRRLSLEAERDALKKQLDELKSGSQPADEAEPNPKDFENPFDYAKALAKHESEKAVKAAQKKREADDAKAEQEAITAAFAARVAAAKKTLTDFDDVVGGSELVLKNDGMNFIRESEYGPQIAYYLCSHDEEAERLNKLSPYKRLAELGKLETRFEKKAEAKEPEVKPVPQSRAPAPIVPLNGHGEAVAKDPSKMTTQEYLAYRQQKQSEKRRTH